MFKKACIILIIGSLTSSMYSAQENIPTTTDGHLQLDKENMQDFINVFCNAHFEKPLGKIAVFIAGSIIATCGAFLIGSSISYAAFPPEKSATTTHKNYRKQCLIRGLIGAIMGCGLTYAGIMAIVKSDRFFA